MSHDSPIKGLERLTEELKLERQKANQAIQERARSKIDVETSKQTIENQKREIQDLNNALEDLKNQLDQVHSANQELADREAELVVSIQQKDEELEHFQLLEENHLRQIEELTELLSQRDEELKAQGIIIETLENKAIAKDQMLTSLRNELLHLRKSQIQVEKQRVQAFEEMNQYAGINEELQARMQVIGAIEDGYQQSKSSNEELRQELETSLRLNSELNQQISQLQDEMRSKHANDKQYQEQINNLKHLQNLLEDRVKEFENENYQLQESLKAEIEAKNAAQERCEAALRNREFLDEQVTALKQSNINYEKENVKLTQENTHYQNEIDKLLDKIDNLESQLHELSSHAEKYKHMQVVNNEIDQLRNQLNIVRKQLIKRDLEDEAGVLAPKVIIEREQYGRQIYENIIQDLRKDLEKMTLRYEEMREKYNEALEQAGRTNHLQDEVNMYKDLIKSMSAENQTVALNATEVAGRNLKANHERQQMLNELHQVENDLRSYQLENQRLIKECTELQEKLSDLHKAKILSDQRATELFANNTKLETSLEDFRQQYDMMTLDLKRSQKVVNDQAFEINEYLMKLKDHQKTKQELHALQIQSIKESNNYETKEKQFSYELDKLSSQRELLQTDNKTLHDKILKYEELVSELNSRIQRLLQELEETKQNKEVLQKQIEDEESQRIDKEISSLKRELSQTVLEWQEMEKEKSIKDQLLQSLQVELQKEREKGVLLTMQMKILEDKLQVASQELSMYRSIDVYHSSMQSQLESFRVNVNQENTPKGERNKVPDGEDGEYPEEQEAEQSLTSTVVHSPYPGIYEQRTRKLVLPTNALSVPPQEKEKDLSQLIKSSGRLSLDDIQQPKKTSDQNRTQAFNSDSKGSNKPNSTSFKSDRAVNYFKKSRSPELTLNELGAAEKQNREYDREEQEVEPELAELNYSKNKYGSASTSNRYERIGTALSPAAKEALSQSVEYQNRLQRKQEREKQLREKVLQEERRKRQMKDSTQQNSRNENSSSYISNPPSRFGSRPSSPALSTTSSYSAVSSPRSTMPQQPIVSRFALLSSSNPNNNTRLSSSYSAPFQSQWNDRPTLNNNSSGASLRTNFSSSIARNDTAFQAARKLSPKGNKPSQSFGSIRPYSPTASRSRAELEQARKLLM